MKKAFTLVELLVVIAILAVLTAAVVLVLNPAELIRQGRDSTRISDLSTVQSAVSFYLSTADTPSLTAGPFWTFATTTAFNLAGGSVPASPRKVDGTGWVGADLTKSTGGSPLGALPVDPLNTTSTYQYGYAASTTALTFELDARLESTKYRTMMTNDGGEDSSCTNYTESTCWFEVGTYSGLNL